MCFATIPQWMSASARDAVWAKSGMLTREQRMKAMPGLLELTDDPSLNATTRLWVYQALREITNENLPNDPAGATGTPAKAPRGRRNLGGRSPGQCWETTDLLSWTNVLLHCPPCQGL